MQSRKDKMRMNLKEKLEGKKQLETTAEDIDFKLDEDLLVNLSRVEQRVMLVKKPQVGGAQTLGFGLQRRSVTYKQSKMKTQ